jgi:hypothetical protein
MHTISRTCSFSLALSLAVVAALLGGCKQDKAGTDDKAATRAPKGASVEPFRGELTEEVLTKANRAIEVYKPDGQPADFASALASAKVALGEPTHVEGSTYAWGFASGDTCTYYALEGEGGKAKSSGTMTIDKVMRSMYEKCLTAIGQAPAAGSAAGSGDGSAAAGSAGSAAE